MITTINSLRVDGFRNLDRVILDVLSPVVAFSGLNRQGKTSCLHAMQMLCLGWCGITKRNGAGADKLIRDGKSQAVIEAEIEIDHEIGVKAARFLLCAVLKRKGANEWTATDADSGDVFKGSREEFWRAAGVDFRHMIATLMPEMFLGTQTDWDTIADVVAPELRPDDVLAECGEHRQWLEAFAKRTRNQMMCAADFQELGGRAYEERRERNGAKREADIQFVGLPAKPRPVSAQGKPLTVDDLPSLKAGVERQEAAVRNLHEELGSSRVAGVVNLDGLQAEHKEAARSENEARLALFDANNTLAQASEALEQAKQHEANTSHDSKASFADFESAERAAIKAANASDAGGSCPHCKREITPEVRKAIVATMKAAAKAAEAVHKEKQKAHKQAMQSLAPIREAENQARSARDLADSTLYGAKRRADAAKSALDNRPEDVRPVEAVEADIAAAEEKLARGRGLVEQLALVKQHEDLAANIAAVSAEIEHLDWAVKAFRDGEVLKPLLRGGLDEFAELCNGELRPYGYTLLIDVDGKKIQILLQTDGGHAREVALCSKGERVLAAFAIAAPFADKGCPVVMDDIDGLDAVWRKQLLGRLRQRSRGSLWVAWASQSTVVDWDRIAAQLAPVTLVNVVAGTASVVDAAGVPSD